VREQSSFALLMLDVDYFKKFNDRYGHQVGDECLQAIASAMSHCVSRPTDMLARYGGEEFAIILPNCDETGVRTIAQRIQEHIAELRLPHESSDVSQFVTVSIGAMHGIAKDHECAHAFVAQADKALYRAKDRGRNQLSF
jgi:diguanylate cyclase (GGDEF)-like protein